MSTNYRAILLKKIKYSERNLILQTYTREEGSKSFFSSVQNSKGKAKTALHGLSILEITAGKGKGKLPSARELNNAYPFLGIMDDFQKSAMLMFCNEVLIKCLIDYDKDERLFDFLESSLVTLDREERASDFHLHFLLGLSSNLGFYPSGRLDEDGPYFDLIEGGFTPECPVHKHHLQREEAILLDSLIADSSNESASPSRNNSSRRILLGILLDYFRIHIEGFNEVKSREVLETIMR